MLEQFVKPKRPVSRVFLHCSDSSVPSHDDIAVIEQWHTLRGFNGVGYHYFVRSDGTWQVGRSLEKTPAAQQGHNGGTIAICVHGKSTSDFSEKQLASVLDGCRIINLAYGGDITFHGHCEVSNKTCPVFDYRRLLGLDDAGHIESASIRRTDDGLMYPLLKRGDSGDAVFMLQLLLGVAPDGRFGNETHSAVVAYQKANGLAVDGIAAKQTLSRLLTVGAAVP